MSAPKRMKKICKQCGKEFEGVRLSLFCSRACNNKAHYTPKGYAPKKCEVCGKEFKPLRECQCACSHVCSKLLERKRRHEKIQAELAKEKRVCPVCGSEFTPEEKRQKYCSVACRYRRTGKRAATSGEMTANGLSLARLREIARLQKVGGPDLYKHSLTWSQAERNWAAAYHLKHHPMRDIHHNY